MTALLNQPVWRVFDQTSLGTAFDGKQSFAIDDALCVSCGSGQSPAVARLWTHDQTVMLGIQDTRLPYLDEGLRILRANGYRYVARNSGGLAVVLDNQVLNLSLIFSEKEQALSIDDTYEAMVLLIKEWLSIHHLSIQSGEIVHSYCPGRYDLSCDGRKFAGISQRRVKKGVAVQIYLCIGGSGAARAKLVRSFYKAGLQGMQTAFTFPDIHPEAMASLEELIGRQLDVSQLSAEILRVLAVHGSLCSVPLTANESQLFGYYYERMLRRNEKAFSSQNFHRPSE
ncbi:MAG: lipoate--protein ligase family protein [Sporolactobacillus sp.]